MKLILSFATLMVLVSSCKSREFNESAVQSSDESSVGIGAELESIDAIQETLSQTQPVNAHTAISKNEVLEACSKSTKFKKTYVLKFSPTSGTKCSWNKNDNLKKDIERYSARAEQVAKIPIDKKMFVCDVKVQAEPAKVQYGDEIIISLNSKIILSNRNFSTLLSTPDSNNLLTWNWGLVAGAKKTQTTAGTYCPAGSLECHLPKSEETSDLTFLPSPELAASFAAEANSLQRADVRIITTGDTSDNDCQHNGLNVKLVVSYVKAPTKK